MKLKLIAGGRKNRVAGKKRVEGDRRGGIDSIAGIDPSSPPCLLLRRRGSLAKQVKGRNAYATINYSTLLESPSPYRFSVIKGRTLFRVSEVNPHMKDSHPRESPQQQLDPSLLACFAWLVDRANPWVASPATYSSPAVLCCLLCPLSFIPSVLSRLVAKFRRQKAKPRGGAPPVAFRSLSFFLSCLVFSLATHSPSSDAGYRSGGDAGNPILSAVSSIGYVFPSAHVPGLSSINGSADLHLYLDSPLAPPLVARLLIVSRSRAGRGKLPSPDQSDVRKSEASCIFIRSRSGEEEAIKTEVRASARSMMRRSRAGGTASPAHRSRSTSVGSQSSNGHGVSDGWRQSFWVNPKLNWWKTSSILNFRIYHESPYRSSWCVLLMDQQWVPLSLLRVGSLLDPDQQLSESVSIG
ncbi:hypothetical protein Acr_00g0002580 [Actinidia rufa]|uniref:Uncharacterized protein n=1 Tax=Actinidia rufa TaxID=165716 RepID=A0A7J0D6Z6_9ERIC|nr:hypothetical protein Acr_00g0002580 [Actinidia rufa]